MDDVAGQAMADQITAEVKAGRHWLLDNANRSAIDHCMVDAEGAEYGLHTHHLLILTLRSPVSDQLVNLGVDAKPEVWETLGRYLLEPFEESEFIAFEPADSVPDDQLPPL